MANFPKTVRYHISFRRSDTLLTPTFVYFRNAWDHSALAAPSITEEGGGVYFFDWTWQSKDDPPIVFLVDGGASIPTEEARYVPGSVAVPVISSTSTGAGGGGGGYSVG